MSYDRSPRIFIKCLIRRDLKVTMISDEILRNADPHKLQHMNPQLRQSTLTRYLNQYVPYQHVTTTV